MKNSILHIGILMVSILVISCSEQSKEKYFPYDVNHEDESYTLPKTLSEISGLAYAGEKKVFCVEDEDGIVFLYDLNKREVIRKIHFGKDHDYEGIAITDNELYVLKSNGTLYKVNGLEHKDDVKTEKITTSLKTNCNAEGLCYDNEKGRLLIACKGSAGKGKKFKDKKVVYAYNLTTKTIEKKPAYIIDIKEIQQMKRIGNTQKAYEKFLSFIGKNNITFNPSSIAIHPITKDVFILSSVGNTLLVMSNNGTIHYAVHLKHSKFKQPEGITFDKKGTMYISNEGRGGKANIKVFTYKPK